jgi:(p)ppGpp synthase/HD superfamily hydrolase
VTDKIGLYERARLFATAAHGAIGQKRRYSGEDYIVHPLAVAELVRSISHTEAMLAAALLHDVVEDTHIPLKEILREFGAEVNELVFWLTDMPETGDRRERKAKSCARWKDAPSAAKSIKAADLIDNSKGIFACDPPFAVVFAREVEALLGILEGADEKLLRIAKRQLEEYKS